MKKVVLIFLGSLALVSCGNKSSNTIALTSQNPKLKQEKPKGNWTVKKEVDENGNLIKYDSIYSYNSSGKNAVFDSQSMDSITNGFTEHVQKQFFSSSENGMRNFDDFFNDEMSDPNSMMAQMQQRMQQQMQAMESQLFQNQPAIPAEPNKKIK